MRTSARKDRTGNGQVRNISRRTNEETKITNMIRITLKQGSYIESCLFDTGSAMNCISADFVKKRGLTTLALDRDDAKFARCANKTRTKILGKVLLQFYIERVELEFYFYVIPNLSVNIILGIPFMDETYCEHRIANRTVKFFNGQFATTLYENTEILGLALVSKYYRIPANSEAIIKVRFNTKLDKSAVILEPITGREQLESKLQGLLVARVLLLTDGPKVCTYNNQVPQQPMQQQSYQQYLLCHYTIFERASSHFRKERFDQPTNSIGITP